ncbi:MAG: hypothetical protein EHM20_10030, partial [Alphaproteobacteria bacterium]
MITNKLHQFIRESVKRIQRYADRFWYPPFIGFLSILDNLIMIIPNDGILISSSMMVPRRWHTFAVSVAIGNTIGALIVTKLAEHQGLPWVIEMYSGISDTQMWTWALKFFEQYGLILVFGIGVTPFMQQPVLIFAGLALIPFYKLAAVIFLSRLIKFIAMAYIGTHAPKLLNKLWGDK